MARKKNTFDFESALGELELIVERMEQGDISLEESLREFENGIKLTRACIDYKHKLLHWYFATPSGGRNDI